MDRVRIVIPVPTSGDEPYNGRSWPSYAAAVEQAGGEAVRLELGRPAAAIRELVRGCSGVLLPGSPADVEPERFGAERDPATAKADEAREAADWTLLEECERHRIPVLGICFGMQSLNVYRGGTLMQDLMPMPVNHSAGSKVAVAHTVYVAADSLLGSLLEEAEAPSRDGFLRLPVNSSHHQAVGSPGEGLRIVARCPEDGVIEAVEGTYDSADPWFLLAVQWHPERSVEISQGSRAMFARLVHEAKRVMGISAGRV
ncbi:MAG TPA: gamma-glutamyl-gamma-aminobutyrate hydrolase family protein [Acidobacteriaceae bacterium]|jgi:putative glutamine amidotransferase|nr:gamma-glutamyl-gamma-aminobutyrate hydrolase family protein [Acidobacteriaceae bacterium]